MPTSVDERVVSMKFDNKNFEKNAEVSLKTLDLLKEKLKFDNVKESLSEIDTSTLKRAFENIGNIDTSKINVAMDRIESRMSTLGIFMGRIVENIADSVYDVVRNAMSQIERVIDFAESGIVQGGYKRASNIQTAKFQLEGVGIAWDDIKGDIDYAVTNTAYSLDQAALVASQLTSAGFKPGERYVTAGGEERGIDTMAMILKSISGVAAQSGGMADYADVGRNFIQILSRGKVTGTDLNELSNQTGINVRQTVADYMNEVGYNGKRSWSYEDIAEMTQKGTFTDPMIMIEALYEKFGEHAGKANETLAGVMANTKAALARIGENFFEPIIENGGALVSAFEVIRQSINDLNKAMKPIIYLLGGDVASTIDHFVGLFATKEEVRDEEGNVVDSKWTLKKKGGLFSGFLEPWKEPEWVEDNYDRDHIPIAGVPIGHWEEAESRASKILNNIRETFQNIGATVKIVFRNIKGAFKEVFPNAEGFAATLVKITSKIKDISEAIKTSALFNQKYGWEKSNFYRIVRGIFSAIDIVIQFGKSFKKHILDPIFNSDIIKGSPIGDFLAGIGDSIWDLDERIKKDGDFFGPFLEKLKDGLKQIKEWITDFTEWAKPYVKDFFDNIVNWWKPVKEILFDTDLSWGEKWDAIKNYFTENFELPGWDKAKTIFEKIGGAIGYLIDKLKEFFGINKKPEEVVSSDTLTTNFAASGNVSTMGGTASLQKTLPSIQTTLDTSTDKLSTIGDRISSFFGKVKEAFGSVNVDTIKVVGLAIVGAIVFILGGIAFAVWKLPKLIGSLAKAFPEQMSLLLGSFQTVLMQLQGMLRAQKVENYSEAMKNIAMTIGILGLTFMAIAGMTAIMEHFGGDKMVDALETAGWVLGQLIFLVGGLVAEILWLTKSSSGISVALNALDGFKFSMPGNAISSVAKFLQAAVGGIILLSAVVVALGLIPTDIFKDGMDKLWEITGILAALIGGILVLNAILDGVLGAIGVASVAGSLIAVAGILLSFAASATVLTVGITVLGLIPQFIFDKGISNLKSIARFLGVFAGAMMFITGLISGMGTLRGGSIAAVLFGISALMTSLSAGLLVVSVAVKILDGALDGFGDIMKTIVSLTAIAAILVAVPTILMKVIQSMSNGNMAGLKTGALFSMSFMIISVGVAIRLMATALESISSVKTDKLLISFGVIEALVGGWFLMVKSLTKMSFTGMDNLSKAVWSMLGMIGAFGGISIILGILSGFDWKEMIGPAIIALGSVAVLWGMVSIMQEIDFDPNAAINVANICKSIALLSLAMIPFAIALNLLLGTVGGLNIGHDVIWSVTLSLIVAMGALAMIAKLLGDASAASSIASLDQVLAIIGFSMALVPIAITLKVLFKALEANEIDATDALIVMGGLAVVIVALGAAVRIMASKISTVATKGLIGGLIASVIAMVTSVVSIAGALALAVWVISKSGMDNTQLVVTAGVLAGLGLVVELLARALIKIAEGIKMEPGTISKIVVSVVSYAVVCGSLMVLAKALSKMSSASWQKITASAVILSALGFVIEGMIKVLTIIAKGIGTDIATNIIAIVDYAIMAGALSYLADTVIKLSKYDAGALSTAILIMAGMGAVLSVIMALDTGIASINFGALIAGVGSTVILTLGIVALANTMMKLTDYDFEQIAKQMALFGGGIALVAVIVAAISAITGGIGIAGMLAFGGMCIGLAAALAAAGVLMYLASLGLEVGVDALERMITAFKDIDENKEAIKEGTSTLVQGFVEGLISALAIVSAKMPEILVSLGKILDSISSFVLERIPKMIFFWTTVIRYAFMFVAGLASDPTIQASLATVIDSILVFTDKHAEGWAEMLASIGRKLATGFLRGLLLDSKLITLAKFAQVTTLTELATTLVSLQDLWDNLLYDTDTSKPAKGTGNKGAWDINGSVGESIAADSGVKPNKSKGKNNWLINNVNEILEEAEEDAESGTIASNIVSFTGLLHTTWREALNGANKVTKNQKGKKVNIFSDTTNDELTEFGASVTSGAINASIVSVSSALHQGFITNLHGGVGGRFLSGQISKVNPYWTGLTLEELLEFNGNVTGGEINSLMQSSIYGLHMAFTDMLNTGPGALVGGVISGIAGSTVFSRKIIAMLEATNNDIDNGMVGAMMAMVANNVSNLFSRIIMSTSFMGGAIPVGQNVTAGIAVGMTNNKSSKTISGAASTVSGMVMSALKKAFGIHSPSTKTQYIGQQDTAGIAVGATNNASMNMLKDSANTVADVYTNSLAKSMQRDTSEGEEYWQARSARRAAENAGKSEGEGYMNGLESMISISGLTDKIKANWNQNGFSISDLMKNFGLDKGISGNIAGAKTVWSTIKDTFTNDSGELDIGWLFEGVGTDVQNGLNNFLKANGLDEESMQNMMNDVQSGLNLDTSQFAIDPSAISFSMDAQALDTSTFDNWLGEFGTFDVQDLISNNEIETTMILDTTAYDNFMNDNRTASLIDSIPTMGGYQKSTVGSTYVNNYNYNQTNNSPTALSTREINRQTELLINRNRNRWTR